MVERIDGQKLYQVTVTKGYKQAFAPDQKIEVGNERNPFFKFYETTLVYPVTNGDTGVLENVNAIEWLFRVRDKTILTSYEMVAAKAVEVSQHYMMLARELVLEQVRLEEFGSEPPSRQTCLYL